MVFQIEKVGKLIEVIDTFSFREDGTISIPKSKREKAYQQSVDIIVQSVSYPQYKNGKGLPSISFYGYAVLVFQDCLSLEIPIHYPRQRIWFDRQWQAQQSWQNEVKFWENYQFHRKNDISLASIMGALEIPYNEIDFYFKDMAFVELPLREVYVKLLSHSQFQIEYTQIEPVPYNDPFDNERDGKSNQVDGDKDAGLPKDGIQPSENPSDDPYQGNLPESIPSFESGFSNINNGLEQADSENDIKYSCSGGVCLPDENGTYNSQADCEAALIYYCVLVGDDRYPGSPVPCGAYVRRRYVQINQGETVRIELQYTFGNGCGGTNGRYNAYSNVDNRQVSSTNSAVGGLTILYGVGCTLPPETYQIE